MKKGLVFIGKDSVLRMGHGTPLFEHRRKIFVECQLLLKLHNFRYKLFYLGEV